METFIFMTWMSRNEKSVVSFKAWPMRMGKTAAASSATLLVADESTQDLCYKKLGFFWLK